MSYLPSSPKDHGEPDAAHRFMRDFLDATEEPPVKVPSVQEAARRQMERVVRSMRGE